MKRVMVAIVGLCLLTTGAAHAATWGMAVHNKTTAVFLSPISHSGADRRMKVALVFDKTMKVDSFDTDYAWFEADIDCARTGLSPARATYFTYDGAQGASMTHSATAEGYMLNGIHAYLTPDLKAPLIKQICAGRGFTAPYYQYGWELVKAWRR